MDQKTRSKDNGEQQVWQTMWASFNVLSMGLRAWCISLGLLFTLLASAEPPELTSAQMASPPSNVMRTCCSFGAEVKVSAIPFLHVTDVISIDQLGQHQFLGGSAESSGLIYTQRGGFIDIGHLRDVADWTAYIYGRMEAARELGTLYIDLGKEGGQKRIEIDLEVGMSQHDRIALASRVAIDLSTWHEIATWFGSSYLPLVPERYSSFSPEDLYSNLLGAWIGMEAISDVRPYEVAMTALLFEKLLELGAVPTEEGTFAALESVRDLWWSSSHALPSRYLLMKRYFGAEDVLVPWLIPSTASSIMAASLSLPRREDARLPFPYHLRIDEPKRLPQLLRSMVGESDCLDQMDFMYLMDFISIDANQGSVNKLAKVRKRPTKL